MPLDELLNLRQKIALELLKQIVTNPQSLSKYGPGGCATYALQCADFFMKRAQIEFNFNEKEKP